tara:strand:+ start:1808 stop:2263 length:456 start_codon:yes stop_codon:yes gene_type:complete
MKNNLLKKYQDRLTVKNSQYFKFVKEKQMSKDGKIDIILSIDHKSLIVERLGKNPKKFIHNSQMQKYLKEQRNLFKDYNYLIRDMIKSNKVHWTWQKQFVEGFKSVKKSVKKAKRSTTTIGDKFANELSKVVTKQVEGKDFILMNGVKVAI